MPRDLDSVYALLKAGEEAPPESGEIASLRDAAADAMAKYLAACLWQEAQRRMREPELTSGPSAASPEAMYKALYNDIAPKALVLITITLGVIPDFAAGKIDPVMMEFLDGLGVSGN